MPHRKTTYLKKTNYVLIRTALRCYCYAYFFQLWKYKVNIYVNQEAALVNDILFCFVNLNGVHIVSNNQLLKVKKGIWSITKAF